MHAEPTTPNPINAGEPESFGQEEMNEQKGAVLDALVWIEVDSSQQLAGRRWIGAGGDKTVIWCVPASVVESHILLLEDVGEVAAA